MNVVEPSPSSETIAASTAVPSTTRAGSALQNRRMPRTIGSNRPTSIITPKKMIANISMAAVGASSPIPSSTYSPRWDPCPAITQKRAGMRMSDVIGDIFFVMISVRNVAIMTNPRTVSSIELPPSSGSWPQLRGRTKVRAALRRTQGVNARAIRAKPSRPLPAASAAWAKPPAAS